MRPWTIVSLCALVVLAVTPAWADEPELGAPTLLEAGGKPMDAATGHAAPFVHDWDGDGVRDLLVGQMGSGHLRIYRNAGTDAAPRFEDFQVFQVGESDATVPSG